MLLNVQNSSFLYDLFFSLAHIVSWIILIWYGYKHKYPKFQWLLIILTTYVFFTIGTHLLAIDISSLKSIVNGGTWPISKGKSLVSGLLLAVPAMLLVKKVLNFEFNVFEPYAISLPIGIAIQRIGCYAVGCCFGKPTEMQWGISYDYGYAAHFLHWKKGLISSFDWQSLAIHPVQIYEGFFCFIITAIILFIYYKKRLRNKLIYLSLLLYSLLRFFIEFFRDSSAHTIGINSYYGLNTVQWILLLTSFALLIVLVRNKVNKIEIRTNNNNCISLHDYVWFIILFLIVLTTPKFYSSLERLLLGILIVPISVILFWDLFKSIEVLRLRMATASLFVLSFFLMSQNSPIMHDSTNGNKYHTFSIGGYLGSNIMDNEIITTSTVSTGTNPDGCTGTGITTTTKVNNQYTVEYYQFGGRYKYINEYNSDRKFSASISSSFGRINEIQNSIVNISRSNGYDTTFNQYSQTYRDNFSMSPLLKFDYKRIGFGLGMNIGNYYLLRPEKDEINSVLKNYTILPQLHFRLGNLRKVWGEVNYGFRFPGISPSAEAELLMGISGKKGNTVKFGISTYHIFVLKSEFYINNTLGFEPFVGIGGGLFNNSFSNNKGFEAGLNFNYRIKQKNYRKTQANP